LVSYTAPVDGSTARKPPDSPAGSTAMLANPITEGTSSPIVILSTTVRLDVSITDADVYLDLGQG
jgi:hypothetical protein